MFLLGGATTGLWLASTGLVRLERNFVLSLAGSCCFCGKDRAEVRALLGTVGCATTICDECVGLCCDILAEDMEREGGGPGHWSPRRPVVDGEEQPEEKLERDVAEIVRRMRDAEQARDGAELPYLRRALEAIRRRPWPELACSFCGAHRQTVRKLVSGPRVFICDVCVGDATAVVSHVLRA
jgi:hypothetical protein